MTTESRRDQGLTTGEFGRRSGLSHKALRLYELSGLLPPAGVDPDTGYRRYRVEQLERARLISLLRRLDMPLATIAELLSDDDRALRRLDQWWGEQEELMRSRRQTFLYLRTRLLGDARRHPWPVRLREVAETKVAAIRREVDQSDLVLTMTDCGERIREHLHAAGAEPTPETWWIYHGFVTPDSRAPVEVCVPYQGEADPSGEIVLRVEPAHTEAYVTITRDQCAFPRIMAAYDAVDAWVSAADDLRLVGDAREVYFADYDEISGADAFAHVAQPVVAAERSRA